MPKSELLNRDSGDLAGNAEALNEAREATKAIGEERRASAAASAKQRDEKPGLHFIPITEEDKKNAFDSAAFLLERQKQADALAKAIEAEEVGKYRFYLKCRLPHTIGELPAPPHGIYFRANMFGKVCGPKDWMATYKPSFDDHYHGDIYCQVCLKMGIEHPTLDIVWVDRNRGIFRPEPRWCWRSPIDPALWEIEGDTRAGDLPGGASNEWRERLAEKKAALAARGA